MKIETSWIVVKNSIYFRFRKKLHINRVKTCDRTAIYGEIFFTIIPSVFFPTRL